jgi:hypothetical protein
MTLICDALAAVNISAWAALRAPRKVPGVHPCELRILCPNPVVDRDQFVLFGSWEILVLLKEPLSAFNQECARNHSLAWRCQTHSVERIHAVTKFQDSTPVSDRMKRESKRAKSERRWDTLGNLETASCSKMFLGKKKILVIW